MDALGREAALRMVVLRGNGKHFQAGADLAWISGVAPQSPAENEKVSRATHGRSGATARYLSGADAGFGAGRLLRRRHRHCGRL
jgi:enoyl-CoA hydratase/carnithine racemase